MCYDKRGSVNNMEQFSRTISLVGQSAFDRVHQARVAVFGVGGVGGYVCEALVRSGIAEIDLFDRDDVSISNLNRQIIALHSTIGQDKVDAMAARLKDINPDVRVNCRKMFYLPTNADEIDLSVYDFVVDAVDTIAAKLELARRCEQGGIRFISAMGAGNNINIAANQVTDSSSQSGYDFCFRTVHLCRLHRRFGNGRKKSYPPGQQSGKFISRKLRRQFKNPCLMFQSYRL